MELSPFLPLQSHALDSHMTLTQRPRRLPAYLPFDDRQEFQTHLPASRNPMSPKCLVWATTAWSMGSCIILH